MAALGAQYLSPGRSTNMTASSGTSPLAAMQARLREQLMHEKESRLLQMAARQEAEREGTIQRVTKSSASTLSSSLSSISSLNSSMGGQGRVRKLFQERRTNGYGHSPVGRDKSYPLEPVRGGGGGGGRPPVKPVKGIVRQRGVSMDRGVSGFDQDTMKRSRSHAGLQNHTAAAYSVNNNYEPRSPARALRPPQGKSLSHHKSTSSLLDANQNYNGRGSSSSSGVYSRGPSREPSPAPSPSPYSQNRFGFRGPPSRGPSPAPPAAASPRRPSLPARQQQARLQKLKEDLALLRGHDREEESLSSERKYEARLQIKKDDLELQVKHDKEEEEESLKFERKNETGLEKKMEDLKLQHTFDKEEREESWKIERKYEAGLQKKMEDLQILTKRDKEERKESLSSERKYEGGLQKKMEDLEIKTKHSKEERKESLKPERKYERKESSSRGVPPITKVRSVTSPPPQKPLPARSQPKPQQRSQPKPNPPPKARGSPAPAARPAKPPPGMESCRICGRHFNSDRLEKHESICVKSTAKAKKRKAFDPVKMRTKGTEAEKFVSKGLHLKEKSKPKKKDWRKQHEDFIATIRAAKTGGAPPPTDNSDYVECPHCGRKFNEQAADRHIPKCASILSNKPVGRRR